MKICCINSLDSYYDNLLNQAILKNSKQLLTWLKESIRNFTPLVKGLLDSINLRVAFSQSFISAKTGLNTCIHCQTENPIVILSASLLLFIWRLQLLVISMIDESKKVPEGLYIKVRTPTEKDKQQFLEMLKLYLKSEIPKNDHLIDILNSLKKNNMVNSDFSISSILADIWIFLHESAHIFVDMGDDDDKDYWPNYNIILNSTKNVVKKLDITPMIQYKWTKEIQADLMATDFLIYSVFDKIHKSKAYENKSNLNKKKNNEYIASIVLAGISTAINALYFIELSLPEHQKKSLNRRDHPALHIRISLVRQYIESYFKNDKKSIENITKFSKDMSIIHNQLLQVCKSDLLI